MGARDQLPDDGKNQTQKAKPAPDEPRTEGGEKTNPERYPPVNKQDSVQTEDRSFEGEGANPEPRRGSDDPDPSVNQGHMGSGGDPAEGKR